MGEYLTEIIVAIITAITTITVTVVANWDKFFPPKNEVKAQVDDYTATDDYELEVRKLMHLTGVRDQLTAYNQQLVTGMLGDELRTIEGVDDIKFKTIVSRLSSEMNIFDESISEIADIYKKYIPLETVVELNKFQSTKSMRDFKTKVPHITQEVILLGQSKSDKITSRINAAMEQIKAELSS